jgi:hypothetical protein
LASRGVANPLGNKQVKCSLNQALAGGLRSHELSHELREQERAKLKCKQHLHFNSVTASINLCKRHLHPYYNSQQTDKGFTKGFTKDFIKDFIYAITGSRRVPSSD